MGIAKKSKKDKKVFDKAVIVKMEKRMHTQLRKVSYELNMSMCDILRDAIQKIIKKHS